MTDERAPEGGSGQGTEPAAPPPAGGWSSPAPEAAVTPPAAPPAPPPYTPTPPAYTPQPAVAWGAAPAAAPIVAGRSGAAMAAGIGLLVIGILLLLIGLLFFAVAGMVGGLAGSGAFEDIPGMPPGFEGAIGGFVAVLGIIVILYSLLYIAGGIGVLRSRGWGRVIGIVVGIISGLFMLSALFSPSDDTSFIVTAVLLAIHFYFVVVLAFFWRSRSAPA
jgi:hypothetical protein